MSNDDTSGRADASPGELPFKLGHIASRHDDRTLRLANYLTPDLPPAPVAVDYAKRCAIPWRMLGNDEVGDCEIVSEANLIQLWTAGAGGEQTVALADVIATYSAVSGYNPRTGANDNGCMSIDVLNRWRKVGIGPSPVPVPTPPVPPTPPTPPSPPVPPAPATSPNGKGVTTGGHKILAFVALNVKNHAEIKSAINLFGGLHCAFDLPRSAATQIQHRQTWTPTPMIHGGSRGSWGGHAMAIPTYDAASLTGITWQQQQRMTWAFWDAYAAEAWAAISLDQLTADTGTSPLGFDLAKLQDNLAAITSVH